MGSITQLLSVRSNRIKRITAIISLTALLILTCGNIIANASVSILAENMAVISTDGQTYNVRSLRVTNSKERYISLADMSVVLKNTDRPFTITWSGNDISVSRGSVTERSSTGSFSSEDMASSIRSNMASGKITVDGIDSSYAYVIDERGGSKDGYMRMTDFVMMADVEMYFDEAWHVKTDRGFHVSKEQLASSGYFDGLDGALIGDATTGEIYFEQNGDEVLEIASTTKLITYTIIKDALANGEIHESDMVTISPEASRISKSEDGAIEYEVGQQVPVSELIIAMLLPSSNESAYAMAEYVAGSESAFIERMYAKLEELGIYDASIYNCHGLPIHTDDAVAAKIQNIMSPEDMFKVVCNIMEYYPETTEITSMKNADLEVAGASVKNTNGVLKNMPEANGLKTGTTSKAGSCLVASCNDTNEAGETHTLVAIVYGAESNTARISYGELMLRLAKQEFKEGVETSGESTTVVESATVDPKKLLNQIMKNARNKGIIE